MNVTARLFLVALATAAQPLCASAPAVDPAEGALIAQLVCNRPPTAAPLIRSLVKARALRRIDAGVDGSTRFGPKRPFALFGFPVVHVTGWQANAAGDVVSPFTRGPGTMPPTFLAVSVVAQPDAVERVLKATRVRLVAYVRDLREPDPQRKRKVPGIEVRAGDVDDAEPANRGLTTLMCMAEPEDFTP